MFIPSLISIFDKYRAFLNLSPNLSPCFSHNALYLHCEQPLTNILTDLYKEKVFPFSRMGKNEITCEINNVFWRYTGSVKIFVNLHIFVQNYTVTVFVRVKVHMCKMWFFPPPGKNQVQFVNLSPRLVHCQKPVPQSFASVNKISVHFDAGMEISWEISVEINTKSYT